MVLLGALHNNFKERTAVSSNWDTLRNTGILFISTSGHAGYILFDKFPSFERIQSLPLNVHS